MAFIGVQAGCEVSKNCNAKRLSSLAGCLIMRFRGQ